MKRRAAWVWAVVASLATTLALGADPGGRYSQGTPSPDGTGRFHEGREIAHVMGWQAAPWLERTEREEEEGISLLLRELDLKPGMVVADIGAGSGYLSRRMAPRVSPGGRIIATDIQPQMLDLLKELAKDPRYANIEPLQSRADDSGLPAGSVDLAIMVDVYHELEYPYETLESLVQALKPQGRLAFVEYRGEDANVPIKGLHKMTEKQIRREAELHGLKWERTSPRLPWQHLVIFRKR